MKNKLSVLLGIIVLMGYLPLKAQEKRSLTLKDAVTLSIQNSHQLKNSEAKIEEATAALREAVEKKLPDATVSGSYLRLNNPNIDMKMKDGNSGGSGNASESPKVSQAVYGMANLSLPIYTGGRIRYGIESSRYLAEAAKLDADNDKEEVIRNTVAAYVNLYKAKTAVDLVKESLQQSQQRVNEFSNLEKNGLLARNDLLKAQLQASNKELALVDANNNWQLANVNMNLLLGLPTSTQLILDSASIELQPELKTLDEYIQSAMKNRKDMAALDLRKKAGDAGVKAIRGEMYPSVALTGGYIAADIPKFFSVTNAVNAGVGVSYSISSLWKTKAKVQQAEAQVKQLRATEDILNDQISLEVNKGYLTFLGSQKKIDVSERAIQQADENYRITKNKYNNSLVTTTDLLDADVAQLEAKVNYVLARADAFMAYTDLLKAAGMLNGGDNK